MENKQEHRLYRGQPQMFDACPLAPSVLREGCIKNLENYLSGRFEIITEEYNQKCQIHNIMSPQYESCSQKAFYAFWLSLVNCVTTYNTYIINTLPEYNPFKCQFFVCPPVYECGRRIPLYKNGKFHYCHFKDGRAIPMGMENITSPEEIAQGCFEFAESFFCHDNLIKPLQWILPDYVLFQHLNFVLSEQYEKIYLEKFGKLENQSEKIVFPTLGLDWTWDKDMALKFANDNGNKGTVMSISFERYMEWSQKGRDSFIEIKGHCDENGYPLPPQESRIPILGMETYRNISSFDDEKPIKWGSENNKWMIAQKGAVIFWPWDYCMDELSEQNKNRKGLGWAFDFEIEKE
jgi:hypothetical protein